MGQSKSTPAPEPLAKQDVAPMDRAEPAPVTSDTFETSLGPLVVTPIWHGTVSFVLGDTTIVVDPWSKAPADRLPKADLVLITDIHPDHLDAAAIEHVRNADTVIMGPKAVADQVPATVTIANGQEQTFRGIGIRAIPMYNEQRGPKPGSVYHDKGRGNGYVLRFGDTKVYLSGDTECTSEMRALQDIDLALVCMNLPYTMPPEEAATCIKAFKPKVVTPYHYRGSDLGVLERALEGVSGIELRIRDYYRP